jgi:hypothetical protein
MPRAIPYAFGAALASIILAACSEQAHAISLTIDNLQINGNIIYTQGQQTGDLAFSSDTNSNAWQWGHELSVTEPGGSVPNAVGAELTAQTRYAEIMSAALDVGQPGSVLPGSGLPFTDFMRQSNFRVTFTVSPGDPDTRYRLEFYTSRAGAIVRNDVGNSGYVFLGSMGAWLDTVATPDLNLGSVGSQIADTEGAIIPFDQTSNSILYAEQSGTRTHTVDITWRSYVDSNSSSTQKGDEAVLLMGLPGSVANIGAADDYPGLAGRTAADDGVFFTVNVVVLVPEPSSIALGLLATGGLACLLVRRRAKSRAA